MWTKTTKILVSIKWTMQCCNATVKQQQDISATNDACHETTKTLSPFEEDLCLSYVCLEFN